MTFLIPLLAFGPDGSTEGDPLNVGDPAPDFTLVDQSGTTVRLYDFLGKRGIVLAFYIKAFTPT